jgi:hypothetical protein
MGGSQGPAQVKALGHAQEQRMLRLSHYRRDKDRDVDWRQDDDGQPWQRDGFGGFVMASQLDGTYLREAVHSRVWTSWPHAIKIDPIDGRLRHAGHTAATGPAPSHW